MHSVFHHLIDLWNFLRTSEVKSTMQKFHTLARHADFITFLTKCSAVKQFAWRACLVGSNFNVRLGNGWFLVIRKLFDFSNGPMDSIKLLDFSLETPSVKLHKDFWKVWMSTCFHFCFPEKCWAHSKLPFLLSVQLELLENAICPKANNKLEH